MHHDVVGGACLETAVGGNPSNPHACSTWQPHPFAARSIPVCTRQRRACHLFARFQGRLIWSLNSRGWYAEPSRSNCGPCRKRTPTVCRPSVYAREVLARRTSPPEISHLLLGRLSPPISKGHVAGDVPLGARRDLQTEWDAGSRRGVLCDSYRASLAEASIASVALKVS